MALGPKQMGEAILRNLEAKTGKTVEAWIALVKKSKCKEKKEVMAFLKSKHGLGHFQAQAVYEKMSNSNIYDQEEQFIPNLFSTPDLLKRYQAVAQAIQQLGKDVRVLPCKTYIPFYRKNQFALAKPFQKDKLLIAVNQADNFQHPRFTKGKSGGSVRINFRTILTNSKDFDSEILAVIKSAYQNN